jgi:oxalate---CoA ligase
MLGITVFRRTLCLLPTHFGHGLICNSLFPWLAGQELYVVPPGKTQIVSQLGSLVDEHAITFMSSVPSLWRLALKTSRPPVQHTLERVICGSAPLSADLWHRIKDWSATEVGECLRDHGNGKLAGGYGGPQCLSRGWVDRSSLGLGNPPHAER